MIAAAVLAASLAASGQTGSPVPGDGQDARIAALHRRAAAAAPGTAEARQIAVELAQAGRERLNAGELGRAIELYGEAYGLDEANGLILAELTLAQVRAGDLDTARFYLRRAESRVTSAPPEIYATLGDVYESLYRLEDAVTAWSEFVRFGGQDPGVLRRLRRARDELALTRGQRTLASDHFALFADPSVPEEIVEKAAEDLEASYREQAGALGARLSAPQVVVLHAGRGYFSLVSVPDWVSGLYDGRIRVSIREDDAEALAGVLGHELSHALVRVASRDRAPGWLHEALAQWYEGRRIPKQDMAGTVRGAAPSLDALEARLRRPRDRTEARAAYAHALSIAQYSEAIRGEGALACVASRLGAGESLSTAMRAETGLTPRELFAGWKRWARD